MGETVLFYCSRPPRIPTRSAGEGGRARPGWRCGLVLSCLIACGMPPAMAAAPPAGPEKDKPAPAETPETSPRRIEESEPSVYYLKDKQGNLQAVPNFTLEDFEELYKLKHQLVQGDPRPRYSLQQMLASGSVNAAGQAELNIQFHILVRDDQWTRIPLRLDHSMLREPAQYEGSGEYFLSFEGEGEGYVAWVRGAADKPHVITLKMLRCAFDGGPGNAAAAADTTGDGIETEAQGALSQGGGQGFRRRNAANARRRRQGNGTDGRRPQR